MLVKKQVMKTLKEMPDEFSMDEAIEKDKVEYAKWWKTLTPQQQKEHDEDVSRLCDVEL